MWTSLAGTLYNRRNMCSLCLLLSALSIIRAFLTINEVSFSIFNTAVFPSLLRRSLYVQPNHLAVLAIWVLVLLVCFRSILGQWHVLKPTSLLDVLYNSDLSKLITVVTLVLMGGSVAYMLKLVFFIYIQWTESFDPWVQSFQLFPAVAITIQTVYQGLFLLQVFGNWEFFDRVVCRDVSACSKLMQRHVLLNITFLVHCVSIFAVAVYDQPDKDDLLNGHDLIVHLAPLEMVYRLFSLCAFVFLEKEARDKTRKGVPTKESGPADPKFSKLV